VNKIAQGIDFFKNLKLTYKVIAIVLFIIVSLSLFYIRSKNIEPAAKQLIKMTEIIQQQFNTKPDFWKLNSKWLIDNQILPKEMIKNNIIINVLGKEVVVGTGIMGQMLMPGAQSFDIVYKNLDYDECVGLSTYPLTEQQLLRLLNITIINGTQEKSFSWGETEKIPLSQHKAKETCSKNNMIIWNFK